MDQYHGPQQKGGNNKRHVSARQYTSPMLAADMGKSRDAPRWAQVRRSSNPQQEIPGLQQSIHRESPGRTQASQILQSSLLDHHHQPAFATRVPRHPMFHPSSGESLREEEEEEGPSSVREANRERYRSNLGESFMSTRVTGTMMGTPEEDQQTGSHNAGVLDLLNQFVGVHGVEGTGRTGVI
jgi:autophagy-related protein 9